MRLTRLLQLIVSLLSAVALSACGPSSPEKLLEDAKEAMAQGNLAAATVNLKAVLSERPSLPEARVLLGKAMLESGNGPAAALEFRKAQELQADPAVLLPLLARALLASDQAQKVVDEFSGVELPEPKANAELRGQVAYAYLALQKPELATQAARLGLESNPGSAPALSALAAVASQSGKPKEAIGLLEKAITANPTNANILSQLGTVQLQGMRDLEAAIATYRKVIEIDPKHLEAHTNLLALMIGKKDLAAAKSELDFFLKNLPNDPQTHFFKAILAHAEKDPKRAMESIQAALKLVPGSPQVLVFAGVLERENKSFLNAERHLSQALSINPNLTAARQHLADTYLRLGNSEKALATLEPLIGSNSGGIRTFALAAEAFGRSGNIDRSVDNFMRALSLDPDDATLATQLALARAKSEPQSKTVAELRKISTRDKGTAADLALIGILMRSKEYSQAMEATDALEKKLPANPIVANLRGFILINQGEKDKARASFEDALKLKPNFFAAVNSLAALDIVDKRYESARARYEAILKEDPKNVLALTEIARLLMRDASNKAEAANYLAQAIKADPSAAGPRLMLINHLLRYRENKAALVAAQEAIAARPDDPDVIDGVGRAQVAAGDVQQAVTTFTRLVSLQPGSPYSHLRLAGAYLAAGNKSAAEAALRKSLTQSPDFVPAQQALISIAQEGGQFPEALQIARTVIKQRPKESVGYVMAGAVELNRRNPRAAATIYREGLKSVSDTRLAVSLHAALTAAGSTSEAEEFAKNWIAQHPKDREFLSALGDAALVNEKFEAAERYFRAIIVLSADDPTALNNLAWALAKQNKRGSVAAAEKAVKLRPGNPGLLDTLAAAHAAEGNLSQAIEVQRQALALAPNDQGLRFHLAKLYIAKGNTSDAKTELVLLEKFGDKLPIHAEVQKLLKSLQ